MPLILDSGGLGHDTPVPYHIHTEYTSSNTTLADSLWEALDSSPIIVALTDSYAQSQGLDLSVRFPWDDTKGIYHIKAFHHIHCLVRFPLPPFQQPLTICPIEEHAEGLYGSTARRVQCHSSCALPSLS